MIVLASIDSKSVRYRSSLPRTSSGVQGGNNNDFDGYILSSDGAGSGFATVFERLYPYVSSRHALHGNRRTLLLLLFADCGRTLLRLLLGFETPLSGRVSYDGQDLSGLDVLAVPWRD